MSNPTANISFLEALEGREARELSKAATISFARLSCDIFFLLASIDPVKCTALMQKQYRRPSFTFSNSYDGLVLAWVLADRNRQHIIYYESWIQAKPPRFYFFTNREDILNLRFLKWVKRFSNRPPYLSVIEGGLGKHG